MIEETIAKLFSHNHLGDIELPIKPVSGGFMHKMYRIRAAGKMYAVKHLNPQIMKRADALRNFAEAERLEKLIEKTDIPIVPALQFSGTKMQLVDGNYFYIFDWHNGQITDSHQITSEMCRQAGSILGRMHALDPKNHVKLKSEETIFEFDFYKSKAKAADRELFHLLLKYDALLQHAEKELNRAKKLLPDIICISDEDMDPKNVMWENGLPYVIDLECLEYGNPVSHALQLALQWAGVSSCDIKLDHIGAFFDAYLKEYDNGFRRYPEVFGIAYTWLEWLEFNLSRALDDDLDDNEKRMGITEVKNTLKRIQCLYKNETEIKRVLEFMI